MPLGSACTLARRFTLAAALLASSLLAARARAQPIELSDPVDLGASLLALPDVAPDDELDELRSDYAIAASSEGLLVAWAELDQVVYAVLLDSTGAITVPRFELYTGSMVRTVRAAFVSGTYVVAAGDFVSGSSVTRLVSVSPSGSLLGSFELGGLSSGGMDCAPSAMDATANGLVITCDQQTVALADPVKAESKVLFAFPKLFGNAAVELACAGDDCVAAGGHLPDNMLDKDVALTCPPTLGHS